MTRTRVSLQKIAVLFLLMVSCGNAMAQPALNAAIENKVNVLLKQMTLEEKVGQMAQISIESTGSSKNGVFTFSDTMRDAVINYKVGSILNSPGPLQSLKDWNRLIT